MKVTKADSRKRIHYRIRKKVKGTEARPRLSVFRSNKYIYCQVIDDVAGTTLAQASSKETEVGSGAKIDQARQVGKLIASRLLQSNVQTVVFDRGGFLYHGRVKSLADGAREGGLQF
jgi:large subunit ribosomal protein L18